MQKKYIDWNPRGETLERVIRCKEIVREYIQQGLTLTLRQLYYQHVARGLVENTERSYKNLGFLVSKARLAGMIDWDAIEDRGRYPHVPSEWNNILALVQSAVYSYRLPRWKGQRYYVELWVEKDALAGVLAPIAREYHVTLQVNRGYSSQSAMYESAKRIMAACGGKRALIFYLGDHDPSGEDMVRDIRERLEMFTGWHVDDLEVKKLALTTEQVEQYNPPPNPTKLTDTRAKGYVALHGHECWEVDALDPTTLRNIIEGALDAVRDKKLVDEIIKQEEKGKAALLMAAKKIKDR